MSAAAAEKNCAEEPPGPAGQISPEPEELVDREEDSPVELSCEPLEDESTFLGQIEQSLDTLTYSGAAINDLELKLIEMKASYQRSFLTYKERLANLRKKLNTSLQRSTPFIEVWRRARDLQEKSNKAAMNYDKANSQHLAAKEMIRLAEEQLASTREEEQLGSTREEDSSDGSSKDSPTPTSPLDSAWQEMLNHATAKVVKTEKERRSSELEHRQIMQECEQVMVQYRETERKLRKHIIKARPYYEERSKYVQLIEQQQKQIAALEAKIAESKKTYSDTLNKLKHLNTHIHDRRRASSLMNVNGRPGAAGGQQPHYLATAAACSGLGSLESLCVADFTGSTGSLPSIGTSSVSELTPVPTPTFTPSRTPDPEPHPLEPHPHEPHPQQPQATTTMVCSPSASNRTITPPAAVANGDDDNDDDTCHTINDGENPVVLVTNEEDKALVDNNEEDSALVKTAQEIVRVVLSRALGDANS